VVKPGSAALTGPDPSCLLAAPSILLLLGDRTGAVDGGIRRGLEMEAAIEAGWKGGRSRGGDAVPGWENGRQVGGRWAVGDWFVGLGRDRDGGGGEGKRGFVSCVRFLFARFLQVKPRRGVILLRACARRWPSRRADTVQVLAKA